ncbi:hypothetical protein ACFVAV_17565 [Nocardia sp. NPDC057663]|uniref:hypothetical protein n=1 Tax=Nocardia sp. NPDC057663 TaxID=3346201 RepID=UPI003672F867
MSAGSTALLRGVTYESPRHTAEPNRSDGPDTTHAVIGIRQTTPTTLHLDNGRAESLDIIDGDNDYATVPLAGALFHDPHSHPHHPHPARIDTISSHIKFFDTAPRMLQCRNFGDRGKRRAISVACGNTAPSS